MEKVFNLMNTILKGTLETQLAWAMSFLFVLSSFLIICIFPLIFNYLIIPRVEERLGKRFDRWGVALEIQPFGKSRLKYVIFSTVVVSQYLLIKFSKNPDLMIKKFNGKTSNVADLTEANFDVRASKKTEIFLSFMTIFNILLWIFSVAIMLIFLK